MANTSGADYRHRQKERVMRMLNVWRFESMGQFITVEAHPENRYGKIIAASDQYKELIGTWVIKPGVNSKWENLASTIGPGTIKYYCNGGKKNDP